MSKSSKKTLSQKVEKSIVKYLNNLDGTPPTNFYEVLMTEIERPLIKTVLEHCNNNQSKTAIFLGISRSTLRKKITKLEL